MKNVSVLLFALAGCTVMVNGKPKRIGGGSDPRPAAQSAATPATTAATPAPARPTAPPLPPGKAVVVDKSIGRDPLVVSMTAVFDTTWSKVFGHGSRSPNCGLDITSRPIGAFEITEPDTELHVALVGGRNDGFVVRKGDVYWTSCDTGAMAPPPEAWQPGRYDVYPVARYGDGKKEHAYELELFRPNAPVSAERAQRLVISGKLDKPMFVEVTLAANRRRLRERHSGDNCDKVALPATPDIALTIERPVPGLTIRPLPTTTPVTMRRERAAIGERARAEKFCVQTREGRNSKQPSYVAPSELRFGRDDEGDYAISLGTPEPGEDKVTLMVFDASTQFDELHVRPFGGENPTLEQRWLGYHMPQLDLDDLGNAGNYAAAERAARVFAAVPKQALVYAKLTFDKDLGGGDGYPVKNEPLVLLGIDRGRATVLTADGKRFYVKSTHVVLAPDGPVAIPAAPRPAADRDIYGTIAMLAPAQQKLGEAHRARVKARDACLDRAWEPYRRQLPSYTRPAGVSVVVYKSARTKQIEEAGQRAMDSKCGTDTAFAKKTEATRKQLAREVEKTRAKLLAVATANLK